ncbi:MAG TPA: DUF4383 domain-containing protein [Micromonosporaceae bacterium]|nr:DUF4383 domain-containing protein [Micromonosporaceae bacterium]
MAVRSTAALAERAPALPRASSLAALAGAILVTIGTLGFIPGVTTGTLGFSSPESDARLLGLFEVSGLLNLVHLLFGVAGLVSSRSVAAARVYFLVGGAIYLALSLYGSLVPRGGAGNVLSLNRADDWLHLLIGIAMIVTGLLTTCGPVSHGAVEAGRTTRS